MFSISDLKNTRYYQEVWYESELNLVMRQLERRMGGISQDLQVKINKLFSLFFRDFSLFTSLCFYYTLASCGFIC